MAEKKKKKKSDVRYRKGKEVIIMINELKKKKKKNWYPSHVFLTLGPNETWATFFFTRLLNSAH